MATKLNITVVEDHDALRALTIEALRQKGHMVQGIACAEAIDDEAASAPTDLFIIDLNLPGEDGLMLSKRIRSGNARTSIIMATGRTHARDRIAGYESGADVYLTKPFDMEELLAAVSAVTRWTDLWEARPIVEGKEGLTVDSRSLTVSGYKGLAVISSSEQRILSAFSISHNRQLEYWQIIELLGHSPDTFRKSSLEVKIVRLRKKLLRVGADPNCLRSIRMVGYKLCIPIRVT